MEDGQYEAVMGCNSSNNQTGHTLDLQRGSHSHRGRPGGPCGVQLYGSPEGCLGGAELCNLFRYNIIVQQTVILWRVAHPLSKQFCKVCWVVISH